MYTRTELLIGQEKLDKLKSSAVLVLGLGGVGGYAAEALARAGVGRLGICDFDRVDITNKNRQILALDSTIGKLKADVSEARLRDINPELQIEKFAFRIDEETLSGLHIGDWDFIADCIDDTKAKLMVIKTAKEQGVPMISSMGTGNKMMDPGRFRVCDIEETEGDPLAKYMRKALRKLEIKDVKVLFSDELPMHPGARPIPTISYMPAIAGLNIAAYIIKQLISAEK
ncbi:MAG: ThiF family adenylyltransferase [Firmicutes bacterium]|nr:ThiF family adenylyltransferase [Bacillota bacterium]